MKQVKLKSIHLVNWRAKKDLTIDFTDESIISGDNGTGKSTIFDAFIWNLFGKDQFDRKDYEIIPTENGKRAEKIDSEVTICVDVNSMPLELKRVLHQKWVRRRGTSEEVFDGCETLYYINDVPKKASEYKAAIDGIIDETVFKLITNPQSFLALHWTKQRELLFQMAGTISDNQIAESNPEFKALLDSISGKSMSDFKKELAARKRKLKEDLDNIQPKIDQTTRLMPEKIDFASIEKEVIEIDAEISKIDLQMSDRASAIRGQYDAIQEKQKAINTLKSNQSSIVNKRIEQNKESAFTINQDRNETQNLIETEKRNILSHSNAFSDTDKMILETSKQINNLESEIETLRQKWCEINADEYKEVEGCLICPIFNTECNDTNAHSKHKESKQIAREKFYADKEQRLNSLDEDGKRKTSNLEGLKQRHASLKDDLQEALTNKSKCESNIRNLQLKLESLPIAQVSDVIPTEIPEYNSLQAQINEIEKTISEVKPVDNSDLLTKKQELTEKRDSLKKELSNKDLIVRYGQEIDNLKKQGSELAQQIADVEKQEFVIADFTKAKIGECESRINGLFEIVKFKLFDTTNDGNEFEACIATNKVGVPISATNTAEKINAGLDIIKTLLRFYNVSAPIFCDGSESVNEYIKTGSQMVFLRVTRDKQLIIK